MRLFVGLDRLFIPGSSSHHIDRCRRRRRPHTEFAVRWQGAAAHPHTGGPGGFDAHRVKRDPGIVRGHRASLDRDVVHGKRLAALRSVLGIQQHHVIGVRVDRREGAVAHLKVLTVQDGVARTDRTRQVDGAIAEEAAAIFQQNGVDAAGVAEEEAIEALAGAGGEGGRRVGGEGGVGVFALVGPGCDDMAVVDDRGFDVAPRLGAGDAAVEAGDVRAGEAFDVAGFDTMPTGLEGSVAAVVDQDAEAFVGALPDAGDADDSEILEDGSAGEDVDRHRGQGGASGVLAAARIDGETFDADVFGASGAAAGDDHLKLFSGDRSAMRGHLALAGVRELERGVGGALNTHQRAAVAEGTEIVLREGPGAAGFVNAGVEVEGGVLAVLP